MKKEFDDDWEGDLSGYKVISIEDLNKGFVGDKNALGDHIINKDNSPDYRSPFHDYRNTPLGYSYLTDNPVSIFSSTGINEDMSIMQRSFLVKQAHRYTEAIRVMQERNRLYFCSMKNLILTNLISLVISILPKWVITLYNSSRDFQNHYPPM